jgi:DNA replication and repair protein RecF
LRNIEKLTLDPCPGLNLIFGPNGSGKSSILEAIYMLGRGKSFRSAYSRRIVRYDQADLTVHAKSHLPGGIENSLGIQIKEGRFRAKMNGRYLQKSSDLALLLPLLLITPDGDKLIRGSPRQRRRFLDWGLFHVEQGFLAVWQQYNRILLQRNTLLRQRNPASLPGWDKQLVDSALLLDKYRRDYVARLVSQTEIFMQQLMGVCDIRFVYYPGWSNGSDDYATVLAENANSDIKAGFTQKGPHRADLIMQVNGKPAGELLSGGQQKLVASSLLLAQAALFNLSHDNQCIILVDDLPAELDQRHRRAFMDILYASGGQTFVTSTDAAQLDLSSYEEKKVFHVEQGKICA